MAPVMSRGRAERERNASVLIVFDMWVYWRVRPTNSGFQPKCSVVEASGSRNGRYRPVEGIEKISAEGGK